MYVRRLKDCEEFKAGDGSFLKELFHSDKGDFKFRYSIARARVPVGTVTKPHILKSSELYYILEGKAIMHIDDDECELSEGCAVDIPLYSKQYIENTGDKELIFLCIVDPAWKKEDEIILE